MNHYIAGILRIILLQAGAALLVARHASMRASRKMALAFVIVGALAVFAWTRFGELHGDGHYVHRWEQMHFYFAAKYLPEVRYADLYKAILIADRESGRPLRVDMTRDLTTFEEI